MAEIPTTMASSGEPGRRRLGGPSSPGSPLPSAGHVEVAEPQERAPGDPTGPEASRGNDVVWLNAKVAELERTQQALAADLSQAQRQISRLDGDVARFRRLFGQQAPAFGASLAEAGVVSANGVRKPIPY